jgi:hypothetical protein
VDWLTGTTAKHPLANARGSVQDVAAGRTVYFVVLHLIPVCGQLERCRQINQDLTKHAFPDADDILNRIDAAPKLPEAFFPPPVGFS